MKKLLVLVALVLLLSNVSYAQKFGYVDTQFILSQMPEYKQAQTELNQLSVNWQQEIETMNSEVEKLKQAYQAEEVLLTDEMKAEKLALIAEKEKAAKEYQKKIFGYEGLLFLKRQELVKPVQDKVFESIEKVSKKYKLQFMFDKAGAMVMIYTDPKHDYTDYVLEGLGLGDKNDVIDNKR
jgi:outer membrane protein